MSCCFPNLLLFLTCFLSKMNCMAIYFRYEGSSSFHFTVKKFHSVSLGFYQTQCISEVIIDIVANPVRRSVCIIKTNFLGKTTRLLSILSGLFLFLFMH